MHSVYNLFQPIIFLRINSFLYSQHKSLNVLCMSLQNAPLECTAPIAGGRATANTACHVTDSAGSVSARSATQETDVRTVSVSDVCASSRTSSFYGCQYGLNKIMGHFLLFH